MTAEPGLAPFHARHDHGACVQEALRAAERICGDAGVQLTDLRRRVLELVWSTHKPVGAYDLLDKLRRERRNAAPPTVYRALEFLLENGLIHRIQSLNAYVGCAAPAGDHGGQFLICRDCGRAAELDAAPLSRVIREKARALGFRAESQTIEVLGLCPRCGDGGHGG